MFYLFFNTLKFSLTYFIQNLQINYFFLFLINVFFPGYPQSYPSDLHCIWNVKAPPGYKVVGQFVEFDLTNSDDCSSDYVQISGKTPNTF